MPDHYGIGDRALHEIESQGEILEGAFSIEMPVGGEQEDSTNAARYLVEAGANCIIVLGGDGTCRAVSKGCGEVPLLPISTGTNNVVPGFIEGTIAGLAAGFIARHPRLEKDEIGYRHKRLAVLREGQEIDQALVDIAVVSGHLTGAKAIWEEDALLQVFVARAQPTNIGISAIVGMVSSIGINDPYGATARLEANGRQVMVPLAPGLIKHIGISPVERLSPETPYPIVRKRPVVLALDGEREHVVLQEGTVDVVLRLDGPWILDVERVMDLMTSESAAE